MKRKTSLKALLRLTRKTINRNKGVAGAAAIGSVGGAGAGFSGSHPGHRKAGTKEGALTGALTTGVGAVVFRRIRGRIIPIRRKA